MPCQRWRKEGFQGFFAAVVASMPGISTWMLRTGFSGLVSFKRRKKPPPWELILTTSLFAAEEMTLPLESSSLPSPDQRMVQSPEG